jgi:DNA repair and recombination protein RAD54B
LRTHIPKQKIIRPAIDSGKLGVLQNLLVALRQTKEKIVLVSNFTSTLDVLQVLLGSKGMIWCRLDGNTDSNKRQHIVNQFNIVDTDTCCTHRFSPIFSLLFGAGD